MRRLCLCPIALACLVGPAAAIAPPYAVIPRTQNPPTVDGRIAAGEWSQVTGLVGFHVLHSHRPPREPTVVFLCYDDSALYALAECSEPDMPKLTAQASPRDSEDAWNRSDFEIFLSPAAWPLKKYAHFITDYAGTILDEIYQAGVGNTSWNPDWSCAVGRFERGWTAEIAIPWYVLKITPREGDTIRANFGRGRPDALEYSNWGVARNCFHEPEAFGTIRLGRRSDQVVVQDLPDRRTGRVTIAARSQAEKALISARITSGKKIVSYVKSPFGDRRARLTTTIPLGADDLAVSVADAKGRDLWRQTVKLDIPDFHGRLSKDERTLRDIEAKGAPAARIQPLRRELESLRRHASKDMDDAALTQLADDIGAFEGKVSDLGNLVAAGLTRGGKLDLPPYYVSNPPVTEKICPSTRNVGPIAKGLKIAMCRGEFEPAQIVVCPIGRDLSNTRVTVSELRGSDGRRIPASRIEINAVGSVECRISTRGAPLSGRIPDVLLPNRPMIIPDGVRQPYLITVRTTEADWPGSYRGTVRVSAENAPDTLLPIIVRVYDIVLPVRSHLRTAFLLWGDFKKFEDGMSAGGYLETYHRYARRMLEFRLSLITTWELKKNDAGEWDFSDYDALVPDLVSRGLTTFNIGGNQAMVSRRDTDSAKAFAAHFKQRGWWDLHYVYGHDEAPESTIETLRTDYSALVRAVPDIKIMQTGWNPDPRLKGLVKIWCPLTSAADLKAIRKAQAAGDEVWWYVCCGPTAPHANFFIDYPGIDHRVLGWQTYKYGIQGFLYWGVDYWSNQSGTVAELVASDYANWVTNPFPLANGDGYLLYPGRDGSPVPSFRLAMIRDGFEDYDLFKEVEKAASRGGTIAKRARDLLKLDVDLTRYPRDWGILATRREKILQIGEELSRSVPHAKR